MIKHPRMIAAVALITLIAVALTGCLVTKKEPEPPYYRKSDNLHIYKQGDWIRYNVIATTLSGTSIGDARSGTLEVRWGNYFPLISPDGKDYDVIEKRYLLCLDGASCDPTETVVIQYIHQDDSATDTTSDPTTDGTERLVVMGNHPNGGEYYWLNTQGGWLGFVDGVQGGQEPVTTLMSPLVVGQQYTVKYDLMDDCYQGPPGCQTNVGTSTNTIDIVGDSTQVNTNLNNYANPLQVNFSGSITPAPGISPLPLLFDIFDICSDEQSTHNGRMFIIPEIGVIQLTNTCTNIGAPGDIIRYDVTVDSISSSILAGS